MGILTQYRKNALAQLKDWVNGISRHANNECCPDFSCCHPDMFERDRAKRVARYNVYAADNGQPPITDA